MSEVTPWSLLRKLIKVYSEIEFVGKEGKNTGQGYKYVRAVDLVHAVRRALIKLNVYVQVNFEQLRAYSYKTAKGSEMNAADVKCTLTFFDGDGDGASATFTAVGLGSAADSGDKYSYKAQTGALKYALRNAFLIPDDADPEADETVDDESDERPAPKAKSTKSNSPAVSEAEEPAAGEKPAHTGTAGSSTPLTDEDTEAMRNKFRLLGDDLAAAGLKAAPKLPIARKLLAYLCKTTGAPSADAITRTQWATFWEVVSGIKKSEGGIKELVKLVDAASNSKKSEEE